MLFDVFKALIFGIVEGVCEWLPISSTGHLILLERIVSLEISNDAALNSQFRTMFDVVIQLGAILAVVVIYFGRLTPTKKENLPLLFKLILTTLPAALIGFLTDALCESVFGKDLDALLFTPATVAVTLIAYGFIFILIERSKKLKKFTVKEITPLHAFSIGIFQALAIIPGTSRSGATILGARLLGINKPCATEFSFFAAVPAILGASLIKIIEFSSFTASMNMQLPSNAYVLLITAFICAFLVSIPIIKFFIGFLRKHTLIPFGIYRIALGIIVMLAL